MWLAAWGKGWLQNWQREGEPPFKYLEMTSIAASRPGQQTRDDASSVSTRDDWGDPLGYSITVNRKGEGLETEYSVVPSLLDQPQQI